MTAKQKKIKLEAVTALITTSGFTLDRWDNYQRTLAGIKYRIKIKKVNIRIEHKLPGSTIWHKISSQPIVKIDLTQRAIFMSRFLTT